MMSNVQIREYVKTNIKGNFWKILGYLFLITFFQTIITEIVNAVFKNVALASIVSTFISILIVALVTPLKVGFYKILVAILEKKGTKISMIFDYYKDFGALFVLGLVGNALISVSGIFTGLLDLLNLDLGLVQSLLSLALRIIGLIAELVYIGILYLYISNPKMSLGELISTGYNKMNGKKGQIFGLSLMYLWPAILLILIAVAIISVYLISIGVSEINGDLLADVEYFLSTSLAVMMSALLFFVAGFIYLICILPKYQMAQAVFYTQVMGQSLFANNSSVNNGMISEVPINPVNIASNMPNGTIDTIPVAEAPVSSQQVSFCPNCGTKVEGAFCINCGTKVK